MMTLGILRRGLRAALPALAALLLAGPAHAADDFLDPEQAFRLSARALDDKRIELRFDIAPGYYLYRERLDATAAPGSVTVAELQVPQGKIKYDETFQKDVEHFRGVLTLVAVLKDAPAGVFKLGVSNQGCADKGLCYSPQQRAFKVEPAQAPGGSARFTLLNEAQAAAWVPVAQSGNNGSAVGAALAAAVHPALNTASSAVSSTASDAAATPIPPTEQVEAAAAASAAPGPWLPMWVVMLLTAVLLGVAAVYLGTFRPLPRPATPLQQLGKALGALLAVFAVAQLVGAATGGRDVARPLSHLAERGDRGQP